MDNKVYILCAESDLKIHSAFLNLKDAILAKKLLSSDDSEFLVIPCNLF